MADVILTLSSTPTLHCVAITSDGSVKAFGKTGDELAYLLRGVTHDQALAALEAAKKAGA